jgi:hypothetical protein
MTALELLKTANKIAFGEMTISPSDMHQLEDTIERAAVQLRKEDGSLLDFRNAFKSIHERVELKMSCTLGNYIPIFGSDEDLQEIEARYGMQDQ